MSRYLDTSLLVSALTREKRTADVQVWLSTKVSGSLAISDWVVTEFSSALSVKLRTRQIDATDRAAALAAFARLCVSSLTILPIRTAHFRRAAQLADQHTLGLRAGDALHLAVALDNGLELCTLDERLAEAGKAVGVAAVLL